jgi:hypothetical protein
VQLLQALYCGGHDDDNNNKQHHHHLATYKALLPTQYLMSDNMYSVRQHCKRKAEMSDLRKVEMSPFTLLMKTWEGCFGVVASERARFAADRGPD